MLAFEGPYTEQTQQRLKCSLQHYFSISGNTTWYGRIVEQSSYAYYCSDFITILKRFLTIFMNARAVEQLLYGKEM